MMAQSAGSINGFVAGLIRRAIFRSDFLFRVLRRFAPNLRLASGTGGYVLVSREADVREVLETQSAFRVPYARKISVIMTGGNMFLGRDIDPERADEKALFRGFVPANEVAGRLAEEARAATDAILDAGGDRVDLAMELTQRVTTRTLVPYFGVPLDEANVDSIVDQTRTLFEFQFIDPNDDPDLKNRVVAIAAELRGWLDEVIAARKAAPPQTDDVLGRALAHQQAHGAPDDAQIRRNVTALLVGGLPQPPMIIPQLFDVLLSRRRDLALARELAERDDVPALSRVLFEALRFFPLTPSLSRTCAVPAVVAGGTSRACAVRPGDTVMALMRSAMHDPRALARPHRFDASRTDAPDMHFGWGPHQCFGAHINRALIPAIGGAILRRPNLRRAGPLRFEGPFASSLLVRYERRA